MMPADRDRLLEAVRVFFARSPEQIAAVYVFGSVARSNAVAGSDLDVAILFERDPPRTLEGLYRGLGDELQEAGTRPVDLIVLNHAPADLVHRVLRDGVLVCERNRSARIAFEVRRRNEYFDLEPVRRRYRRIPAPETAAR